MYWLLFLMYPAYIFLVYCVYRGAFPNASLALRFVFVLLAFSVLVWNSLGAFGHADTQHRPTEIYPVLLLLVLLQAGWPGAAYGLFAASIWWSPDAFIMCGIILSAHEWACIGPRQALIRATVTLA